jgi:hypothetical protein
MFKLAEEFNANIKMFIKKSLKDNSLVELMDIINSFNKVLLSRIINPNPILL